MSPDYSDDEMRVELVAGWAGRVRLTFVKYRYRANRSVGADSELSRLARPFDMRTEQQRMWLIESSAQVP